MFLEKIKANNQELIRESFVLHQEGKILPNSYVVDMDTLLENAEKILQKAKENGIRLYFMLKQIGRNPYIAKKLVNLGYAGAVVVDYKEAQVMMRHNIPLCNVGHLVQIPTSMVKEIIEYGVEVMTVYSIEKIKQIGKTASELGKCQNILLRVYDDVDLIYSGQTAGFHYKELENVVNQITQISGVKITGVTSFPCYLYNENTEQFENTHNLATVMRAVKKLKAMGITVENINTPSATCCVTLDMMKSSGSNCAEPGHGLTGTTPAHAKQDLEELPCVVYVSEISHNFSDKAYCYGGGHYRRSSMENAIVGKSFACHEMVKVTPPDAMCIDYHLELSKNLTVGDTVVMAFRYQIFVTRADVVLVEGIHTGTPHIVGVYDSLGREQEK